MIVVCAGEEVYRCYTDLRMLSGKKFSFFLFTLCFVLFFAWLWPQSLTSRSGDAYDIWQAIITYYDSNPSSSYVMYKGFLSVYPYVWMHAISQKIGVESAIFIKVFYSLIFSFVSTLGMPFIFEYLVRKKVNEVWKILFTPLLFFLWRFNLTLNSLVIDLPSLGILVASVCLSIKMHTTKFTDVKYILLSAPVLGLLLCGSGQYQLSFYFLLAFIVLSFLSEKERGTKSFLFLAGIVAYVVLISIAIVTIDTKFQKNAQLLAQKNEEWFLSKQEWLDLSLSGRNMLWLKYNNGPVIDNNRTRALAQLSNPNFESIAAQGGFAYPKKHFFKLILKHPFDFISQWGNKFFLGLSLDNGTRSVLHLGIAYTVVFFCVVLILKRIQKIRDVIRLESLIVLAFLLPSFTALIFHVEMRYFLSIQILLLSAALFSLRPLSQILNDASSSISQFRKKLTFSQIMNVRLNFFFIAYVVFMGACFSWYASIYDSVGVHSSILFTLTF